MMGVLFSYLIVLILATAALLFGILAFSQKKVVFFYLGIIFVTIALLVSLPHAQFILYAIQAGHLLTIASLAAWLIAIIFLILSKTKPTKADNGITDSFLNDIINADDEEWDPES